MMYAMNKMTTVNSRPSHGIQYTVRCNAQICREKI